MSAVFAGPGPPVPNRRTSLDIPQSIAGGPCGRSPLPRPRRSASGAARAASPARRPSTRHRRPAHRCRGLCPGEGADQPGVPAVHRRGAGNEGLRADWQRQLAYARQKCGFQYIRMHGLFTDDMGVYSEDKSGRPVYNWQYVDRLYDFLLSIHVRPFVELGFMPGALASGRQTIFWWRGNVTPPRTTTSGTTWWPPPRVTGPSVTGRRRSRTGTSRSGTSRT